VRPSVSVPVPVSVEQMSARQVSGLETGTDGEQSGEKSFTVNLVRSMSDGSSPKPGKE
jgi:hypothetical protein